LPKRSDLKELLEFKEEKLCEQQGYRLIAGVDEVGRGCLAGPVIAAAVIMPRDRSRSWFRKVKDSKLLTAEQREFLSPLIHSSAISIGTGVVYPDLIDARGMTLAVRLAMKKAIESLLPRPDFVLIDYLTIPDLNLGQKGVVNGDTLCFSIACASIIAKVFRDRMMIKLDQKFPGYGLAQNKGYGTAAHIVSLRKLGPTRIHRRLFWPVKNAAQLSFDDMRPDFMLEDSKRSEEDEASGDGAYAINKSPMELLSK
jgi:ribonuclease HII